MTERWSKNKLCLTTHKPLAALQQNTDVIEHRFFAKIFVALIFILNEKKLAFKINAYQVLCAIHCWYQIVFNSSLHKLRKLTFPFSHKPSIYVGVRHSGSHPGCPCNSPHVSPGVSRHPLPVSQCPDPLPVSQPACPDFSVLRPPPASTPMYILPTPSNFQPPCFVVIFYFLLYSSQDQEKKRDFKRGIYPLRFESNFDVATPEELFLQPSEAVLKIQ